MKKFFKYMENIWVGKDGKPSIRRVFAIILLAVLIRGIDYTIVHCSDKMSEAAMLLGIPAALIASLLALTTYQNMKDTFTNNSNNTPTNSPDDVNGT